jgi:hypothetical protein
MIRVGDDTTNIFWGWPEAPEAPPKLGDFDDQPPAILILERNDSMTPEAVNLLETQLIGGFNAASTRRVDGADAHAEHSRTGYLIGKDRMSIADSMGYRTATESGSGRTRILDDGVRA